MGVKSASIDDWRFTIDASVCPSVRKSQIANRKSPQRSQRQQQLLRPLDGLRVRLVQPIKLRGALDAEGVQQQDHLGQVAALNLGGVALGPVQLAALGPEPVAGPGRGAPGAAFALLGGGPADGLEEECADAALGVVARDPGQPAIDHVANAINGDRGLRDVGGDHHLAQRVRREREVLVLGRQVAVQGD